MWFSTIAIAKKAVGYASFKIYSVQTENSEIPVLWIERKGDWERNNKPLQPPYKSGIIQNKISKYEDYYNAQLTDDALKKFDADFGAIHGYPDGADPQLMSWDAIGLMQPKKLDELQNYKVIDYLMHNMQRFETVIGWAPPVNIVGVSTEKIAGKGLLISVFSPLNRAVHHTLLLIFN